MLFATRHSRYSPALDIDYPRLEAIPVASDSCATRGTVNNGFR